LSSTSILLYLTPLSNILEKSYAIEHTISLPKHQFHVPCQAGFTPLDPSSSGQHPKVQPVVLEGPNIELAAGDILSQGCQPAPTIEMLLYYSPKPKYLFIASSLVVQALY
jgi:hypothetical protein